MRSTCRSNLDIKSLKGNFRIDLMHGGFCLSVYSFVWLVVLVCFTSSQEFHLISSVNQTVCLKSFNFLSEGKIF